MYTGSVVVSGPVTKKLITMSSSDMAKASSTPESTAGRISGSVTVKNALCGDAPRSRAASSSAGSSPWSRACTFKST